MNNLKKNQIFTVKIDAYSAEAMGICHIDGCVVFVPGTIPGETWEIKILKVLKDRAYAKGEKLLEPSPFRVAPGCSCYGKCGGCDTLHISYEEELRFKLSKVNDCLERIGKQSVKADTIIGSDEISHYRNKAILAVGDSNGKAVTGFFRERSHQIIPVENCLLQDEFSHRAALAVTEFMNINKIPAYDEESGKGIVRHVFTRRALHTEDRLICIVARKGFGDRTQALIEHLKAACPELSGIVLNINKSRGNTVLSGDFYTLWGKENITDSLCAHSFDIAPQAFFQINPPQAEKLYNKAVEYAELDDSMLAFDLYCGAGTISLCLAEKARNVIAAEIVPEAIKNANKNAAANGISNVEFICADAGQAAQQLKERGLKPHVVVVDPPRKGMYEDAVRAVASMNPERIVYVSCDPATLARDILRFNGYGYQLVKATAVDMFPRTKHVESVALLIRKTPHEMKLYASPFEKIKNGTKNIELRLYDEKRQNIKAGDDIIFTNAVTGEKICAAVKELHLFDSFEELYKSLPLLQCGYTPENIATAHPSDMTQYYSVEEQQKYGVVGIELFPPKSITD